MAEQAEHWFNRRYRDSRRDVYLRRTPTGWQVLGRKGGSGGEEVAYYFDTERDARAMVGRLLAAVPPELSSWEKMTARRPD